MRRFFTTLSITASLLCLQPVAYAQEAADLMITLSESETEISVSPVETYRLGQLPVLEREISEEDLLPLGSEQLGSWTLYLLPHLSPDSNCPRSENTITLICFTKRNYNNL